MVGGKEGGKKRFEPVLVQNLCRHQVLGSDANSSTPGKLQTLFSCLNPLLLHSVQGPYG